MTHGGPHTDSGHPRVRPRISGVKRSLGRNERIDLKKTKGGHRATTQGKTFRGSSDSDHRRQYKPFIERHFKETNVEGRPHGMAGLPATAGAQVRQQIKQKRISTEPEYVIQNFHKKKFPYNAFDQKTKIKKVDVSEAKTEQMITQIKRSQKFHGAMTGIDPPGPWNNWFKADKPKGSKKVSF